MSATLLGPLADPYQQRDSQRLAKYTEYLDFYNGVQWDKRPLPSERRITSNYTRALVKKAVSYLFPEPPTFTAVPDRESGRGSRRAAAAEAIVAEVYADSDLATVDFVAALDAAVLGDGAFKVTWDADRGLPVVTPVDVRTLSVWWRSDDLRVVTKVCQKLTMSGEEAMARYGGTLVGNPAAVLVVEEWTADRWKATTAGAVLADAPNPYGRIPYVLFPNEPRANEFWGVSDLVDLLEPAKELNRRISVVSKILELSGNPIAVLENVESAEGIQVGPGALWELPEGAKAYLLDLLQGGGVTLHLEFVDKLYRVLHDLAEVPRTAFGDTGRALSGVALEVEVQPLVQKVKRKRRIWDSVFARRNALILDYAARFGGAPIGSIRRTRTLWAGILPSDRKALVDQEVKLVEFGLSARRTSIARLGEEDPEAELALIKAEGDQQQQQQSGGGDVPDEGE